MNKCFYGGWDIIVLNNSLSSIGIRGGGRIPMESVFIESQSDYIKINRVLRLIWLEKNFDMLNNNSIESLMFYSIFGQVM